MTKELFKACVVFILAISTSAEGQSYPKAKVSFEDFKDLVVNVESHRAARLIDFDTFLKMSEEPGVIILDARSDFRFPRIHLKGARHLSFTEFTQNNLFKVIPSFNTKILIYCNNNFEGDELNFASKVASPKTQINDQSNPLIASQVSIQEKPKMMALNIPTYINLYGYGYHNVYELNELVNVKDPRVKFEGTLVNK